MSMMNMNDVLKSVRDLPSLPLIVVDLLAKLGQDDADSRLLAEKISHDQALTAKTLRLANSSFYGMQRKVATIQQAIAILGFDSVRTLVTAAAIIGNFSDATCPGFDFNLFWRHAIATALSAKALARQLQLNQDQAFLAGLLHDVGRLVLIIHAPDVYQDVLQYQRQNDCNFVDAEQALLGIDHTASGRALAEHWKFPSTMQKAIELHHNPDLRETPPMSALIHAADAMAHGLDLCGYEQECVPLVVPGLWRTLRLDQTILIAAFREVDRQFEEACQILAA